MNLSNILLSLILVNWTALGYEVDVEKREPKEVCEAAIRYFFQGEPCHERNYPLLRSLERARSLEQTLQLIRQASLDTLCQEGKKMATCFLTELRKIPSECDSNNPSGASELQFRMKVAQDTLDSIEHTCKYYLPTIRQHIDCLTNVQLIRNARDCYDRFEEYSDRYKVECTSYREILFPCFLNKIDNARECKVGARQLVQTIGSRIVEIIESWCKFNSGRRSPGMALTFFR